MKNEKSIDAKLVVRYQSGDKQALSELVKRWHLKFCRKAHWIIKDADLSKDIAQESWKTILNKINDLKEPKQFGAWATRIVYTKSLDAIRANVKERHKKESYAAEHKVRLDDDKKENEKLKETLLKAIRALPNHQQHVIKLYYVENYTLKEISEILSISVGTAKSRLFHAREKLKQQLKSK